MAAAGEHNGVVAFEPLAGGRERIKLGQIPVGEISPVHDPRSRFPFCFRIDLPLAQSAAWMPAGSIDDAQRQALGRINDWLNAAQLRPIGAAR